jgi:sigma-B regulation protein RsbU (phosphoserine phosphatase)
MYLPGIVFTVRSMTGILYTRNFQITENRVIEIVALDSPWLFLYLGFNLLVMTTIVVLLIIQLKKPLPARLKKQTFLVLVAFIVTIVSVYSLNIVFVILKIDIPVTGHLAFMIGIASLWYAIVRYRLMSITSAQVSEEIVASISDPLLLVDLEGVVVHGNHQVLHMAGRPLGEIIGRHFDEILPRNQVAPFREHGTLPPRNLDGKTLFIHRENESPLPLRVTVSPVYDEFADLVGYIIIGRDISDTLELEKKNRAIMQELSLARQIQMNLIPQEMPDIEGITISALYHPMTEIGGDYYNFIRYRDDKALGLFVSDVAGHGVPAALITAMVNTLITMAGEERWQSKGLLKYINDNIRKDAFDHFLTALYAVYRTDDRTLTYTRAGHSPPMLVRQGDVTLLESRGPLLGVKDDIHLETKVLECKPGDLILFYTDGLTEATNYKMEPFETIIQKVLRDASTAPPGKKIHWIWEALLTFRRGEPFEDDVLILCMEIE